MTVGTHYIAEVVEQRAGPNFPRVQGYTDSTYTTTFAASGTGENSCLDLKGERACRFIAQGTSGYFGVRGQRRQSQLFTFRVAPTPTENEGSMDSRVPLSYATNVPYDGYAGDSSPLINSAYLVSGLMADSLVQVDFNTFTGAGLKLTSCDTTVVPNSSMIHKRWTHCLMRVA